MSNIFNFFKSFEDYEDIWTGIKDKCILFIQYALNPLEKEAYKTGFDFSKQHKTQLIEQRKNFKKTLKNT